MQAPINSDEDSVWLLVKVDSKRVDEVTRHCDKVEPFRPSTNDKEEADGRTKEKDERASSHNNARAKMTEAFGSSYLLQETNNSNRSSNNSDDNKMDVDTKQWSLEKNQGSLHSPPSRDVHLSYNINTTPQVTLTATPLAITSEGFMMSKNSHQDLGGKEPPYKYDDHTRGGVSRATSSVKDIVFVDRGGMSLIDQRETRVGLSSGMGGGSIGGDVSYLPRANIKYVPEIRQPKGLLPLVDAGWTDNDPVVDLTSPINRYSQRTQR